MRATLFLLAVLGLSQMACADMRPAETAPGAAWIAGSVQTGKIDYRSFAGFSGILACAPSPRASATVSRQDAETAQRDGRGEILLLSSDWFVGLALVHDRAAVERCGFTVEPLQETEAAA